MKVLPINTLLTLILLILCTVLIAVIYTQHASSEPVQEAQSLRIPATVTVPSSLLQATPLLLTAPTPIPASTTIIAKPDQYRTWMVEARLQYPYGESLDTMWSVMLCESSGNADVVADIYYGLFQYDPTTWAGDWNPYREIPILDPHAQIFATAKAWHEGNQGWWGCYPR